MDSSEEKKYLEKLQEFVEDEDKIVTVSFLARTLEISIQDCSKLLDKYVENQKKSHPNGLTVTYVITGTLKDRPGSTVCMVKDSLLEEKKKSLQNVTSQVIYSVQKASNVDFNAIALVDWGVDDPKALPGTICSKNCTRRTIKVKVLPSPPKPVLKGKSSYFVPKAEKTVEKATETTTKTKPAGAVADLFNKATTSSKPKQEQKTNNSKSNNVSKSQGRLSTFFSKSSSSSLGKVKSEEKINGQDKAEKASSIKENEPTDEDFENFMEVDFDEDMEEVKKETKTEKEGVKEVKKVEETEKKVEKAEETEKKVKKAEGTEKKVKKAENTKKNKKEHSKRKRDGSEDKDIKRRKRIIQYNESDSDDIFEKEEEDIIETSEPEQERVPTPPPAKILPPKNKKRKAVENTYMDDEGYVVTKTEYIFESASEDENEEPPKPTPKKQEEAKKENGITKKSSNSSEGENSPKTVAKKGGKKGKKNNMQNQPTLMNFFKKK